MTLDEARGIYTRVSIEYSSNYPDSLDEMDVAVRLLHREMEKDEALTEQRLLEKVHELKLATEPQYRSKFATQVVGLFWTKTFIEPIKRNRFKPDDDERDDQAGARWREYLQRNSPL
jgi:hypothetical protein